MAEAVPAVPVSRQGAWTLGPRRFRAHSCCRYNSFIAIWRYLIVSISFISLMPFTATASVEEVAQALGLHPVAVRTRIKDGRLSAVRIGRGYRVRIDSVNALLEGRHAPQSARTPMAVPTEGILGIPLPLLTPMEREIVAQCRLQLQNPDPQVSDRARQEVHRLEMLANQREISLRTTYGLSLPKQSQPIAHKALVYEDLF